MVGFVETRVALIGELMEDFSENIIPSIKRFVPVKTTQKNFDMKLNFYEDKMLTISLSITLYRMTKNANIKNARMLTLNEELGELISESYLLLKTVKLIKNDTNLRSQLQSLRISLYNNGLININQGVRK